MLTLSSIYLQRTLQITTLVALAALLVIVAAPAPVAHAATCTVTNASDSGSGSLREKISDATCDTINFAGDYTIHLASQLTINRTMTIDGIGHSVTISGDTNDDGVGDVRVFWVTSGVTFNLNQITVTMGFYPNESSLGGGGLYNSSGSMTTLTNSTFSGNRSQFGGAIYNASTMTVTNSTFSGNTAYAGAGIKNYGILNVTNAGLSANSASSGPGGGIHNAQGGEVNLTNTTLTSNVGRDGGGIYNDGTLTVTNSGFTDNFALRGGGIRNAQGGEVNLTNTTLTSNMSPIGGGGIYNNGTFTVTNSTLFGNFGYSGGAILNDQGTLILANSTLSGNSATNENSGIENLGTTNMTNSIVAKSAWRKNCSGAGIGGANNLTDDDTCGWQVDPSAILLGALGNYGGDTMTVPLLPGSVAIDATSANCPATDQRGVTRSSPVCDIGAFESRGFAFSNLTGTPQSAGANSAFATPLGLNVSSAYGEPVDDGRVILTAPTSGASIAVTPFTLTIASGAVSQSVTANGTTGSYSVTASSTGVATPAQFALTNLAIPTITSISPTSAPVNAPPFTLTVTGTIFIASSYVEWNGNALTTTYVSSTKLTAIVPKSLVSAAGAASVEVYNPPGYESNSASFTITAANSNVSLVSSRNPSTLGQVVTFTATVTNTVGGSAPSFDLRSGRVPRSPRDAVPTGTVTFYDNGVALGTGMLNASGAATYTTSSLTVSTHPITATYPGDANFNSGTSNQINQVVNNPAPTVTSISPSSAAVNAPDFTLTVTGTNFIAASVVRWNGSDRATTFVSTTKLTATITKNDLSAAGTANVTVFSPTPGGGTSNTATFTINSTNSTVTVLLNPSCNPCMQNFVTITATVTNTVSAPSRVLRSPRDAVPTGTVTFKDGANNVAGCVNRALNGAGQAICATTLAGGTHTITAQYGGDANFNSATGTLVQKVNHLIILPWIMRNAPY